MIGRVICVLVVLLLCAMGTTTAAANTITYATGDFTPSEWVGNVHLDFPGDPFAGSFTG